MASELSWTYCYGFSMTIVLLVFYNLPISTNVLHSFSAYGRFLGTSQRNSAEVEHLYHCKYLGNSSRSAYLCFHGETDVTSNLLFVGYSQIIGLHSSWGEQSLKIYPTLASASYYEFHLRLFLRQQK